MSTISKEDREARLKAVFKKLEKDHGKGSVGVYSEMTQLDVETTPTGSLGVDLALGVGGFPRGRVIEVYGPEASGKTTLALHAVAECQKAGGLAAFIDAEHAIDPSYAAALGVDMDSLVMSQPDYGEQGLQIALELVESQAFDLIVIDSVAALVPKAELEGEIGDHHVGRQARMLSQALRKMAGPLSKSKTSVIFINQLRMKIGVMFGNPETTSGGKAMAYYSSVRIDIRRVGVIKKGDEVIGGRTRVKIAKNKVAPPLKTCEFDILYGKGISKAGEILDAAVQLSLIEKSGAWYKYEGVSVGQGRDATRDWLLENPEVLETLERAVHKHFGIGSGD